MGETPSPRASGMLKAGAISYEEVKKHNTPDDLWMIICGKVYNLTDFASEHPGGAAVVLEQGGLNATEAFLHAHPESIMTLTLGEEGLAKCLVGEVDMATVPDSAQKKPAAEPVPELSADTIPPLEAVLNLHDFEAIAQRKMVATGKKQAWDYYSSGADDELTYNENVNSFQRIWLKPRVMVNVREVEVATTLLGTPADFPVYLSAVAMCGMGHEDGECAWMEAANKANIPFMIPNLSSKPFEDIAKACAATKEAWFQIYVNPDKKVVKDQLVMLEKHGIKALCITVDSAVPGKRERDLRNKIAQKLGQQQQQQASAKGTVARKAGNYANRDPGLSWDDLDWFKANTKIPLVLKGIQCAEDAVLAARHGCKAIILSNHGGRNLDTSRSGIEILEEVMHALRTAETDYTKSVEVFIDGGIRRGTDIVKALALGARGVGLGKPAVYSMSAYGADGIVKMLEILKEELVKCMQLVGAPTLGAIKPTMVNTKALDNHTDVAPIPPSPYVKVPAPKNVRSPEVVGEKTKEDLKKEIADLQRQLDKMDDKKDRHGVVGPVGKVAAFGAAFGVSLARTVFSNTASGCLHRSAILLFMFLITHAMGNLALLGGPNVFNEVAYQLQSLPGYAAIEAYLLLGLFIHTLAALYFTKNKIAFIMKNPLQNGKLLLSGVAISLFTYMHVMHFRFGEPAEAGAGRKDYYRLVGTVLADPVNVALYVIGTCAVFLHLNIGWPKTVLKMNVGASERPVITAVGKALVAPLAAVFVGLVIYMHLTSSGYIEA